MTANVFLIMFTLIFKTFQLFNIVRRNPTIGRYTKLLDITLVALNFSNGRHDNPPFVSVVC